MFIIRTFISKKGSKCSALCYKNIVTGAVKYVSFDKDLLLTIMDCSPSHFDSLSIGDLTIAEILI